MSHSKMFYDKTLDRWTIDLGGRAYGLHCGECFGLVIGKDSVPCRLELDRHWFVVMQDVRMNLRAQDTYKVII